MTDNSSALGPGQPGLARSSIYCKRQQEATKKGKRKTDKLTREFKADPQVQNDSGFEFDSYRVFQKTLSKFKSISTVNRVDLP